VKETQHSFPCRVSIHQQQPGAFAGMATNAADPKAAPSRLKISRTTGIVLQHPTLAPF
jgi:hypothetical protein